MQQVDTVHITIYANAVGWLFREAKLEKKNKKNYFTVKITAFNKKIYNITFPSESSIVLDSYSSDSYEQDASNQVDKELQDGQVGPD